jgi:hypothetical protein
MCLMKHLQFAYNLVLGPNLSVASFFLVDHDFSALVN